MTDEEVMLNKTAESWQREDLSAYEKALNTVEVLEYYFAAELNDVRVLHGVDGNEALRQLVNNSRRNADLKERLDTTFGKGFGITAQNFRISYLPMFELPADLQAVVTEFSGKTILEISKVKDEHDRRQLIEETRQGLTIKE